jgi:DNA polymerase I
MTLRAWDIETTTRQAFKRKATPFGGLNHAVVHAWQDKGPVQHVFAGKGRLAAGWLKPVLDGCKLLAGFNIKFDLLHALQDPENLEAWMEWVTAGGQVWDGQLAEYLLNGMVQQDHMLSLDEVAPRYGGQLKFDEVKVLWQAGVQTDDIEPKLLLRYLCGEADTIGDVGNTMLIANGQIKRARAAGQLRSILLNMGALLCSIEIERNGMFVDKALGLDMAKELSTNIDQAHSSMAQYLPEGLPFEFKWTSPVHKSALIFGGGIRYPKREYLLAKDYGCAAAGEYLFEDEFEQPADMHEVVAFTPQEVLHYVLEDGSTAEVTGYDIDLATSQITDTRSRFASGKQKGEIKTKKVKAPDYTKPKSRLGEDRMQLPGYTKPNKEWEWESRPGVYTTDAETIELLANRGVPFLVQLAKLQKMVKDLGTYFITTDDDGNEKGMLSLVGDDGIIHHKINHTSTVTARFSSSDPNLQNIPKGNKSQVKTLFVSRFGPEGKLIQSDFSSLEIYIQAILTDCKQLIIDLKAGVDLHCKRLSAKTGRPYDEVLLLCKGDKKRGIEADKEWDYLRTGAKVFSFQRAYGAGAKKISDSTGMPLEDVEALIAAEALIFPEIDEYFENRTKEIKANRRPAGIVVPHPVVRGVTCALGRSFATTPDGKVYSYMESPSPEYLVKKGVYASFSPTEIKNYEVQGEGGEWAKAALWLCVREFYRRRNFGGLGLLVNQVHDATYADAHKDTALEVAATLHACMEGASDLMEWYFDWPLQLPVPSDTTWGASMMDDEAIPGVRERAATIRQELRVRYMDGYTPSFI